MSRKDNCKEKYKQAYGATFIFKVPQFIQKS